jgi:hypothetical protein
MRGAGGVVVRCQETREEAAAALLAGQPWGSAVHDHLATCSECRTEVDALRPVVALLALAPPRSAGEDPGDLLLRRTLAGAAKERRRRRLLTFVAAAAALLIIVPAAAWMVSNGDPDSGVQSPSATTLRAAATDPASGVEGTAQIQPSVSGSELVVEVRGVQSGTRCNLVVVDRLGDRSVVETWTATYSGDASVTTQTTIPVSQVSHVELVDASADALLLHFKFA